MAPVPYSKAPDTALHRSSYSFFFRSRPLRGTFHDCLSLAALSWKSSAREQTYIVSTTRPFKAELLPEFFLNSSSHTNFFSFVGPEIHWSIWGSLISSFCNKKINQIYFMMKRFVMHTFNSSRLFMNVVLIFNSETCQFHNGVVVFDILNGEIFCEPYSRRLMNINCDRF